MSVVTPTNTKNMHRSMATRLWTLLGFSFVYCIIVVFKPFSPAQTLVFSDITGYGVPMLTASWVLWDCMRTRRETFAAGAPREQQARWQAGLFFGLGALSFGVGSCIWAYYELHLKVSCPFPSMADAAYLCCYPCLFLGVLLMPNRPLPLTMRWRVLLDGCMIMTALVTFSWYFLLGPLILAGSATTLGMLLGVGYPLGDLIALLCMLIVTVHNEEQSLRPVTWRLGFGIAAFVSADVPFAYLTLHSAYDATSVTTVGWILGWGLISLAGAALLRIDPTEQSMSSQRTSAPPPLRVWRALTPYLFVPCVAALVVYSLKHRTASTLDFGVYIGSALLIGLLLVRQVLSILENNHLTRQLQEAYSEMEETNKQLQNLATTDGMTGLSNHRDFQERLRVELSEAQRHGTPLSLLLLDVDHFKLYNDTFGHPAGDHVLRTLATLLRDAIRDGDLAARYGGEEFAVLLPNAGSDQARATAERIRAAVSAFDFPNRKITVSIGVTDISIAGTDPEDLIESADTALYAAKHTGRNRWVVAGDTESLISAA
ncbi:MAG: GGDEF domain-containing protein [Capsulimonas sp.]|uniref:GGDEF domain-containing protein n=1 Tax=Capsulimonas sp. TaxID=2494211 RepID=UPI003262DF84